MEGGAFVSESGLSRGELAEVFDRLGDGLAVKADDDAAHRLVAMLDVKVDLRETKWGGTQISVSGGSEQDLWPQDGAVAWSRCRLAPGSTRRCIFAAVGAVSLAVEAFHESVPPLRTLPRRLYRTGGQGRDTVHPSLPCW